MKWRSLQWRYWGSIIFITFTIDPQIQTIVHFNNTYRILTDNQMGEVHFNYISIITWNLLGSRAKKLENFNLFSNLQFNDFLNINLIYLRSYQSTVLYICRRRITINTIKCFYLFIYWTCVLDIEPLSSLIHD